MNAQQYKRAANKFEAAVKLWPKMAEAHSNLGYCYRKQQKYNEAIAAYHKAIKLKPKLSAAHEKPGRGHTDIPVIGGRRQNAQSCHELHPHGHKDVKGTLIAQVAYDRRGDRVREREPRHLSIYLPSNIK